MDGEHETAAGVVVGPPAVAALTHEPGRIELLWSKAFLSQAAYQSLTGRLGKAKLKGFHRFPADAAPLKVGARVTALGSTQAGLKEIRGDGVNLKQDAAQLRFGVGILRTLGHRDAVALREHLERLR